MYRFTAILILVFSNYLCFAQPPLPAKTYKVLQDSITSVDIVLYKSKAGSLSVDGPNVRFINAFVENKGAAKSNWPQYGTIMWQINGREYLSGNFFLGDSTGYIVSTKDGKEYVNEINKQGTQFLRDK